MKKAVLIVHGFVGTLYDNEYLMNYLEYDKNYDVFARTLPGHHTNDNYQKVEYTEWIRFMDMWIKEVIDHGYKTIYLVGHSMGGILIAYLASRYKEVKKIVFLNAAFHYMNLKQNKVDLINNKDYKEYVEVLTRIIHTTIPFFLEFTKLVKEYNSCLDSITCDSLILQSEFDQVVPKENGIKIFENIKGDNKYLTYLTKDRHELFFGDLNNLDRKRELAEYVKLFLKGGSKWKKNYKEKI